jgi:ABC-type glycerol-3-phosphate transport system substrate-binding protein
MKIRIATHDDQRMVVIQEAVKQFRKENPGVSMVLEMVPDKTELMQQLISGSNFQYNITQV